MKNGAGCALYLLYINLHITQASKTMTAPTRMARQLTGGNVQEGIAKSSLAAMDPLGGSDCDADDVQEEKPVSVCMIGTGEYTTGYVYGEASDSDKGAGGRFCERRSRCHRRRWHCWFCYR